jgi:hypothetical protein
MSCKMACHQSPRLVAHHTSPTLPKRSAHIWWHPHPDLGHLLRFQLLSFVSVSLFLVSWPCLSFLDWTCILLCGVRSPTCSLCMVYWCYLCHLQPQYHNPLGHRSAQFKPHSMAPLVMSCHIGLSHAVWPIPLWPPRSLSPSSRHWLSRVFLPVKTFQVTMPRIYFGALVYAHQLPLPKVYDNCPTSMTIAWIWHWLSSTGYGAGLHQAAGMLSLSLHHWRDRPSCVWFTSPFLCLFSPQEMYGPTTVSWSFYSRLSESPLAVNCPGVVDCLVLLGICLARSAAWPACM